jgi:hypothetical protein
VDPDGKNTPGRYAPRFCFDVALGLGFGMEKNHPFMNKMINLYADMNFKLLEPTWGKTIVAYTTEALIEEGLKPIKGIQKVGDITIYPHDFFAPINVISGKLCITKNTYTIHRYMGSWTNSNQKGYKERLKRMLPEWLFMVYNKIKRRKYRIK